MQDQVVIASLVAVAIGLAKVIEKVIEWAFSKLKPEEKGPTVVTLDPESSRLLRETWEHAREMHGVVAVRDNDGVPMIFTPRRGSELSEQGVKLLYSLERIQEGAVEQLKGLGERLERVDHRSDEILRAVGKG